MRLRLTVFLDSKDQAVPVGNLVREQGLIPVGSEDFPILDTVPVEVNQNTLELILAAIATTRAEP